MSLTQRPSSFVLILSSLALAAGCGSRSHKDDKDDDGGVQQTNVATPFGYELEDPACQDGAGEADIGAQEINTWNGQAFVAESFPFAVNGTTSVNSAHIDGTLYGYHERTTQTCTVDAANNISCEAKKKREVLSEERDLKLCRKNGPYKRESIEGVTLSSIANIERAYSKYKAVPGGKDLARATLLVMPNYEEVINASQPSTGKKVAVAQSLTDNAAFAAIPGSGGADDTLVFVIFPRSKELTKDNAWKEVRLWEIPWVMAHEFSHQIFYTHYSKFHTDTAKTGGGLAALPEALRIWGVGGQHGMDAGELGFRPEFRAPRYDLSNDVAAKRSVKTGDSLAAVNEGFADLMATYLLGGAKDTDPTANLPCLAGSRNPHAKDFADGKAKIMTDAVRATWFSTTPKERKDVCDTSFQDEHHIGAIFAYGVDALLQLGFTAETTDEERAGAALRWLAAFDAERAKVASASAEDVFVLALKGALAAAKGDAATLKKEQCDVVKTTFPVYTSKLFKDAGAADGAECE